MPRRKKSDEAEALENINEIDLLPAVSGWFGTGCTLMDLAIANQMPGGIPKGRIVHVFGANSTCKSVLATTVLGYGQRAGYHVYYADVEHTLDQIFALKYGLNCADKTLFHLDHPETLEKFFDEYLVNILRPDGKHLNTDPKIIAVDSVTALTCEAELTQKMEKGTFGTARAKLMGVGLRKYISDLANSNTTLFMVDQTRDNVGVLFGKKEVVSGGRALEFYSSVQIYLKGSRKILNKEDKNIGMWIKFEIVKNKVAPPFRSGEFRILYDYGLDDIDTNVYYISVRQNGPKAADGLSTKIKMNLDGQELEQKKATWVKYIEDNNLEEKLRNLVSVYWEEEYRADDRKPRVW